MGENFVIMVCNDINDDTFDEMQKILDSYGAVSTGNQFGGGVVEYFFEVDPKKVKQLKNTLQKKIRNKNITYEIY